MTIVLTLECAERLPAVEYRWDPDTEILTAQLVEGGNAVGRSSADTSPHRPEDGGASGSVVVEGHDGSWLTLDVVDGYLRGIQVAIWPEPRYRPRLESPSAPSAMARLGAMDGVRAGAELALEVSAPLAVEVDADRRNLHFTLGRDRTAASAAIAAGIVLELDPADRLRGLWLLDVPSSPMSP